MLGVRLAGNMAAAVAGKGAATLFGFLTFVVLARELGAAGLGDYRVVLTLVTFVALLGDFGLYAVTLREMARRPERRARILGSALACRLVLTALPLVAAVLVAWAVGAPPIYRHGLALAGTGWIAYQGSQFLIGIFQERLHQEYAALAEAAATATSLAAVLGLAALGAGPVGMLGGTALGFGAGFGVSLLLARRVVPFQLRFDPSHWRTLMWTGLPMAGSMALLLVHVRGDVLLLALFRTSTEVGIYDIGIKLYEVATALAYLFGGLLMPLLTRDLEEDGGKAGRFARRLGGALAAVAAAVTAGAVLLVFFAEPAAVLVGGEEFRPAAAPLRILALAIAAAAPGFVLRFAALADGREAAMLRVDAVAVGVGLAVHLALIPGWSYTGAATGKLVTDALMLAGAARLVLTGPALSTARRAAAPLAAGAATMVATVWLVGGPGAPWPAPWSAPWPIAATAGLAAYLVPLVAVPGLRRSIRALSA